jgi:hypothetical protein
MKYDGQFEVVFQAIRELMMPPAASRKRIGFRLEKPRSEATARPFLSR